MKSIFLVQERCELPSGALEWQLVHDSSWDERVDAEIAAEDTEDDNETRVVEFVELTPRVRLGLWLAEEFERSSYSKKVAGRVSVWLDGPSETAVGTGPTLDAAIEDALAKLPKEPK